MLRVRAAFHPMLMLALLLVARAERRLVLEGSQHRLAALRSHRADLLQHLAAGRVEWDQCVVELRTLAARAMPSVRPGSNQATKVAA